MTDPVSPIERFDAEVAGLKLRTARTGRERLLVLASVVVMVGGLVLALVAYAASLNVTATPGSNVDLLDSNSYEILALVGVGSSVVAGLVFLRYSLAQFLRFWLLRQAYEQQAAIAAAPRDAGPGDAPPSDAQPEIVTTPGAPG